VKLKWTLIIENPCKNVLFGGHLINVYYAWNLKVKMSLLKKWMQIGKLILGGTKFTSHCWLLQKDIKYTKLAILIPKLKWRQMGQCFNILKFPCTYSFKPCLASKMYHLYLTWSMNQIGKQLCPSYSWITIQFDYII
jgi:hypothetical protein